MIGSNLVLLGKVIAEFLAVFLVLIRKNLLTIKLDSLLLYVQECDENTWVLLQRYLSINVDVEYPRVASTSHVTPLKLL